MSPDAPGAGTAPEYVAAPRVAVPHDAVPHDAASHDAASRVAAWSVVLDDLEARVTRLERDGRPGVTGRADADGTDPAWTAPTGLGPVPSVLTTRASSVLARQRAVLRSLVDDRAEVVQQLGAVRRVEASHEPGRPVYLDALG